MLIATLPPANATDLIERMFAHPLIAGARYNVGTSSPFSVKETLERLLKVAEKHKKTLWIDLKGRQLRIIKWAIPTYDEIVLNHVVHVDTPAKVIFRGGFETTITHVQGNRIFVDPPPFDDPVGAGQALNIHGHDLMIQGYLTEQDEEWLSVCQELGILNIMLSFVETWSDIEAVDKLLPDSHKVLKIESDRGVWFVRGLASNQKDDLTLMAARDDLWTNMKSGTQYRRALEDIIHADENAICASHIFSSLEHGGRVNPNDFTDLELMRLLGYMHFMLSDGISHRFFDQAMLAWQESGL